jgi:hypothetical protein
MREIDPTNNPENSTEQKDKQRRITTIKISATNRGFPAMWESGGGLSNTGYSQIITDRQGEPRRPVFVRNRGDLACKEHALITVHEGFYIVKAGRHHDDYSFSISRIVTTKVRDLDGKKWEATADVELLNSFRNNAWEKPLDPKLEAAVKAARRKTQEYHCRSPYFIDHSEKKERPPADRQKTDVAIQKQNEERARLREKKAAAKAAAQAAAEQASRVAKENGLADRLRTINEKLKTLGIEKLIELGETYYKWGLEEKFYTEENAARIERFVESKLKEQAVAAEKKKLREEFEPKFSDLKARAGKLGLEFDFFDDSIKVGREYIYNPYSQEGLAEIEQKIIKAEKDALAAAAAAKAEARYQELKAEGIKQGLPQDIEIWHRRGSSTNVGEGWVIGADGNDREPTRNPKYGDGNKFWEQVLPGEVVLKWSKSYTAAPHEFEVVHLPPEGLTEKQRRRILEIEQEIAKEWEGRTGLASGKSSPAIGKGWNLNKQ